MKTSSEIFNKKIGETMELLEVAGNVNLKRAVRSKLWNLKKDLEDEGLLEEEDCNYGRNTKKYSL